MTPTELLKPRYEVIADYPGSEFAVGSILIFIPHFMHRTDGTMKSTTYTDVFKVGNEIIPAADIDNYPHLFRPLAWWEHRKPEDLLSLPQIWKDIKGYEGLYQISDIGLVKSVERFDTRFFKGQKEYQAKRNEKLLTLQKRKDGYLKVQLCKGVNSSTKYTHRLVAEAFIENAENKPCVNHLNSNRSDNRAINLEWCTHSENLIHAVKTNDYCGKIKNRKKTPPLPKPNTWNI